MNQIDKDIIVIYHANCLDGLGSAYAAWLYFKDKAEYIAMQHSQKIDFDCTNKEIYILDFSFKNEIMKSILDVAKLVVLIDHHKSAFEELTKVLNFPEYSNYHSVFDMTKSGCVLSWEFFNHTDANNNTIPTLLLHIQDNDLWKFELEQTKTIIAGLNCFIKEDWVIQIYGKNTFKVFDFLSQAFDNKKYIYHKEEILNNGTLILNFMNQDITSLLKHKHEIVINDIKGLACNASSKYASDLGHLLANESGTFGCVYWFNGENWIYSLRSNGDFDVSEIALKYGGGGHCNAASFTTKELSFKQ